MKKWIQFGVLCAAILFALYAASLGIFLSYKVIAKTETRQVQVLPSTDLSELSFQGCKIGEEISITPYDGWESDKIPNMRLTLEDGTDITIKSFYETGGIDSVRLIKIHTYDFGGTVTACYGGETISSQAQMQNFLGDSYIDVSQTMIYIDRENNLKLMADFRVPSGDLWGMDFEEFNPDDYDIHMPKTSNSVWNDGLNPIFVSIWVFEKLFDHGYTIFHEYSLVFNNTELLILPIYYLILSLPILAMIVFKNKEMRILNAVLLMIYIVWFSVIFFLPHV